MLPSTGPTGLVAYCSSVSRDSTCAYCSSSRISGVTVGAGSYTATSMSVWSLSIGCLLKLPQAPTAASQQAESHRNEGQDPLAFPRVPPVPGRTAGRHRPEQLSPASSGG